MDLLQCFSFAGVCWCIVKLFCNELVLSGGPWHENKTKKVVMPNFTFFFTLLAFVLIFFVRDFLNYFKHLLAQFEQ